MWRHDNLPSLMLPPYTSSMLYHDYSVRLATHFMHILEIHLNATQCNTLQRTATRCNVLRHCNTLQHSCLGPDCTYTSYVNGQQGRKYSNVLQGVAVGFFLLIDFVSQAFQSQTLTCKGYRWKMEPGSSFRLKPRETASSQSGTEFSFEWSCCVAEIDNHLTKKIDRHISICIYIYICIYMVISIYIYMCMYICGGCPVLFFLCFFLRFLLYCLDLAA